jgi:hypothetical protein
VQYLEHAGGLFQSETAMLDPDGAAYAGLAKHGSETPLPSCSAMARGIMKRFCDQEVLFKMRVLLNGAETLHRMIKQNNMLTRQVEKLRKAAAAHELKHAASEKHLEVEAAAAERHRSQPPPPPPKEASTPAEHYRQVSIEQAAAAQVLEQAEAHSIKIAKLRADLDCSLAKHVALLDQLFKHERLLESQSASLIFKVSVTYLQGKRDLSSR